jgi:anti-sigma-K factor RskA
MSDVDVHHLAAAYAVDALEAHERAAFEAHFESCDVCRADVEEFRRTMAVVAEGSAVTPPASMKAGVLDQIGRTRQLSPLIDQLGERRSRRRVFTIAALGLAAAMVLVAIVVLVNGRSGSEYAADLAMVMEQPDARMLELQPKGAEGAFKVAWSNSMHHAVLIGERLPPAPAGKAYELWLITPEQSMAMAVLDPARSGEVHRTLDAPAEPSAWAITLEPTQGSAVATGDIMFIANA